MLMAFIAAACVSCSPGCKSVQHDIMAHPKILIAYFSTTDNTQKAAERLWNSLPASKLHRIVPTEPYTEADLDYRNENSRSSREMADETCRPGIVKDSVKTEDFDIVYIGYPIWWFEAPRVINTFIESHSLECVQIRPFATSGGSEVKQGVERLRLTYPDLKIADGVLYK